VFAFSHERQNRSPSAFHHSVELYQLFVDSQLPTRVRRRQLQQDQASRPKVQMHPFLQQQHG